MDDRELMELRRELNEVRARACRLEMLVAWCAKCGMPVTRDVVTGRSTCASMGCGYQEALERELELLQEREEILRWEQKDGRELCKDPGVGG